MKYQLEKYKGPHSRYTCPGCGHRREFVRYIDLDTGQHVAPGVGKCNREDNCGYHLTPGQYFRDQGRDIECRIVPSRPPDISVYSTITPSYCDRSYGLKSNFAQWLIAKFRSERVEAMADEYHLGYTRDGSVIFWQISITGEIRTGKVMQYDPATGRNTKRFNWVHSLLKDPQFVLKQCLDGEHLLAKHPDKPVLLVESYKNARVVRCLTDHYVCVSTDCKGGFTVERCRALKGRNVMVLPDCGAYDDWKLKAEHIANKVGCRMIVSDFLERIATPEQKERGYDIADWIIDQIDDKVPLECIADKLIEINPFYHPRIERIINSLIKRI